MKPNQLVLIVGAFIVMIALFAFFPQLGLFTLSIMNQIKNWVKIVFYNIYSKASGGWLDYV